jgi:hypothetical protein
MLTDRFPTHWELKALGLLDIAFIESQSKTMPRPKHKDPDKPKKPSRGK